MNGSELVCVFCEVLWTVPKEYVCSVKRCKWFRRSAASVKCLDLSEVICTFCEVLWVGPKVCVCSVKFCGLV